MTTLRLRVLKRHTSLEGSFEDFFGAELLDREGAPDLNLSVFDIDLGCLVQTHAEYVVSLLQPPPKKERGGLSLDGCQGDFVAVASPARDIIFSYSSSRHHELRFLRDSELRTFALQVFLANDQRRRFVSKVDVLGYGTARLEAHDEEWVRACEDRPKWKSALVKSSAKPS